MKNFADSLVRKIRELENPTVMGLDPRLEYIPEEIRNRWMETVGPDAELAAAMAIYEFNTTLIDAVCDIVPAISLLAMPSVMISVPLQQPMLKESSARQLLMTAPRRACSTATR